MVSRAAAVFSFKTIKTDLLTFLFLFLIPLPLPTLSWPFPSSSSYNTIMSALSASKQKRLAAKAAKENAKKSSGASTPATGTSGRNTPIPPLADEADGAVDTIIPGLNAMDIAKKKANDRNSTGVLTSQPLSRDIKIESFSLSFHGRELISNTDIDINFGRRYGLIGANGSGKSTFLECLANREVPIPNHIDVSFDISLFPFLYLLLFLFLLS